MIAGVETQPLGDVDARRSARNAQPQRVGRRQRLLVEADRRIEHARPACAA